MAVLIDLVKVRCGGKPNNVKELRCPLVILTHRQSETQEGVRVRERSKGASPNLTKHTVDVQRITTCSRKASWVDNFCVPCDTDTKSKCHHIQLFTLRLIGSVLLLQGIYILLACASVEQRKI